MRYFDNERDFTRWALKEARKRGWLAAHLSNMAVVRRRDKTIRAVPDRDAAGFPDLVLVHPVHGLLFGELKMPGGRLRREQVRWLRALREAGCEVWTFYPEDQDDLLAILDGDVPSTLSLFDGVTS